MSYDSNEVNVTNLGFVPEGMTFLEAVTAIEGRRKYQINPAHQSQRLTFCEVMREIHRIADGIPSPERERLQLLAAAGFDFGKRMDARMKELKRLLEC